MSASEGRAELDALVELAEDALADGDIARSLALCGQVVAVMPDHAGAHFLFGETYRNERALDDAEDAYRRAIQIDGSHAAAWSGLSMVLIEMHAMDEALLAATRAIRLDPDAPDGWWCRSLIRERLGDIAGSDRDQRRASLRDPVAFPWPVRLSDAVVEAITRSAIRSMHPSIQSYLAQVAIVLEEVPSADALGAFDPPPPAHELLGLFSGYNLMDRNDGIAGSGLPGSITLFRRNLERFAHDRDMLIEELRVTVLHEVGHYLGLDEDDLHDRGLD